MMGEIAMINHKKKTKIQFKKKKKTIQEREIVDKDPIVFMHSM